ncbi:thiolase family protein [Calidifontibacillus erzurumensis]|uniref:Acetoacetyl-CoA thiolase n=1 Tax=Calidifontibacillus erzurumensis TaxID=2741433 RepID=A0A8J8GER2_9BACI|nr:thiolase family protein [Calidifontibacillus erzurumensis]NSL50506.1 thiolase family protein [Calidifontibacillus erzurumensis]
MEDVYIVDGIRTPIGKFCGSLSDYSAKDLAKVVMNEVLIRTNLNPEYIDEIITGIANQPTDASNIGRVAALELGFSNKIPAYSVNRNCGSGIQAIYNAFQSIRSEESNINLVVGTENMSQWPYLLRGARQGFIMRNQVLVDSLWDSLEDPVVHLMMGQTAEIVANEVGITREEQDQYAFESHRKAINARNQEIFSKEIVKVVKKDKRGNEVIIEHDEGPNELTTVEKLSKLPPTFEKGGTITAGNSCGINDGAAALLVTNFRSLQEHKLKPRARIVSIAFAGLEPERMGLGPVYAVPKALSKAGLSLQDIDLIELNEAFAAQTLACMKLLELDSAKVNIHGGAIALGHPIGATGVRLIISLLNSLEMLNKKYGVATLCIGGGLGGAIVIENLNYKKG